MSEMGASDNCPYDGEGEVRSLYLAGRLPEAEANAFERHYFDCALCAEALEMGTKLRAGFGKSPIAAARPASPVALVRRWLPLAAAATIALVGIGVWQLGHRSGAAPSSVLRGGAEVPAGVRVESGENGALSVRWTAVTGAARYAVRVLSSDGAELWKMESERTSVELPRAGFHVAPGKSLLVEVEALDARGRVLGTSEPVPVP